LVSQASDVGLPGRRIADALLAKPISGSANPNAPAWKST